MAGRYAVERELGHGGMATVYLARDERHGREVALKVFFLREGTEEGIIRFLNEIKVASRLAHPNILPVHDSGQGDRFLYYVMPYVPGENLRERLNREGALPVRDALGIAGQVANALGYAHSHGVIHRDIKPENILFLAGHAVVADFGIARAISAGGWSRRELHGERSGTPAYMSPEQASGSSRVDGRSDQYSLGCVLYEMLCGEPPFRASTPEEMATKHLIEVPEPVQTRRATLSAELQLLVGRALSKEPADRYPTVQQFGDAIAQLQAGQVATPIPGVAVPRTGGGRWRWLLPAAALAAVIYAAFASASTRRGFGTGATDPGHIAVAPFVHHESAAPLLLTGDQCSRLIRESLARWDDVSLVDSRWFDDRLARLGPSPALEDLLRVARDARAGRLVSGEVWPFRDSIRIRAVLYETGRGARVMRERTVTVAASLEDLEARFEDLADSLLLSRAQTAAAVGGALGTRLLTAWQAYDSAHAALARWDLPAALGGFTRALERDPGYALAHLWLAQTASWLGQPADSWRDHALAGLGGQPPLPTRDREWALALAAIAEARFPEACERFDAMIRRDSLDFRGWYGRAECRARDPIVVRDAKSPSGWRFRSSYQAAIDDYQRALLLVPSAHQAFKGAAFARLVRLYYAEPNMFRRGTTSDPDAARFAGFPELEHDSLSFTPWPLEQVSGTPGRGRAGADPEAMAFTQRRLMQLTAEWARAFPGSAAAVEAEGMALELVGEFGSMTQASDSALHRIQAARRLATDTTDLVRLGSVELRLLVKQERFAEAAKLAESLLRSYPAPDAEAAPYLAAAAALTGRMNLAATLARQAAPELEVWNFRGEVLQVPLPLRETALALEAYSAIGMPQDTVEQLFRLARRQLGSLMAGERRAMADAALLDRSRSLLYPGRLSVPISRGGIPLNYLLQLQEEIRRGDATAAREILGRLALARASRRPGDLAAEAVLGEALAELALGDSAAAARRLGGYLDGIAGIGLDLTERPVASGSLVRVMTLRARLAAAAGDHPTAAKWAGGVIALWQRADPALAPLLAEMRVIAARPS